MTTKRKATTGKSHVIRPKLKKETIKDLDAKSKGKGIKGGKAWNGYCFSAPLTSFCRAG